MRVKIAYFWTQFCSFFFVIFRMQHNNKRENLEVSKKEILFKFFLPKIGQFTHHTLPALKVFKHRSICWIMTEQGHLNTKIADGHIRLSCKSSKNLRSWSYFLLWLKGLWLIPKKVLILIVECLIQTFSHKDQFPLIYISFYKSQIQLKIKEIKSKCV